jgi:hypothetical protein
MWFIDVDGLAIFFKWLSHLPFFLNGLAICTYIFRVASRKERKN